MSLKNSVVIKKLKKEGNAVALELVMNFHKQVCTETTTDTTNFPTRCAYQGKINAMKKELARLKKNRSRKDGEKNLTLFLDGEFIFPQAGKQKRKKEPIPGKGKNEANEEKSLNMVITKLGLELQSAKDNCEHLKVKLNKEKCKCRNFLRQVKSLNNRNEELRRQKRENNVLLQRIKTKNTQLKRNGSEITHLKKKNAKLMEQVHAFQNQSKQLEACIVSQKDSMQQQSRQINDTIAENDWLREMAGEVVCTKNDKGHFTDNMKQCVFDLLNHNVPTGQIAPVINAVMSLAGRKASDMPCKSTVIDWNIMRLIIAQRQIAEEVPSKKHLGLLSDETSKFGRKFEGFHVSDSEGKMYVLGLRNMATKSGQDTLTTFQQILRDVEDTLGESGTLAGKTILSNISCTMSDRAATQVKFNELLEQYRADILPITVKNYDSLSDTEKLSLGKLCNFFCGLHALVHLAEVASASLLETQKGFFEKDDTPPILDKTFLKQSEPGATRLIRTTCKAVAYGGDEKSGCHASFTSYVKPMLTTDGFKSLPIDPFKGSRFNILFQNAASIFYFSEPLVTFLEFNRTNKLLKSVYFDLQVPEYLAACKALGLVSKLITVPLWSIIEDSSIHILDIGSQYQEIIDFLALATEKTDDFITGKLFLSFHNKANLKADRIYLKLLQRWEHDEKVIVILKIMLPAMAKLLEKMFSEHLKGGRWDNANADVRDQVKGLPKHNKFSESIFGHLDRLLREKPNITTIASEAYIMFSHNHTLEWLKSKSKAEKSIILFEARKGVKPARAAFKKRQQEIQEERIKSIKEKMKKAEEIKKKALQLKEKRTTDIIYWGLWQTEEQVDNVLESITTNHEKVLALKAQLDFRKFMLQQKPEEDSLKDVYNFTKRKGKGRVNLTYKELAANLKKLVQHAFRVVHNEFENKDQILVGKRVKHRFKEVNGNEAWHTGKVISQV